VPGRRFITYGFSHQADYQIAAFTQRGADLSFDLHRPDGGIIEDIQLRLPGEHMARNAAAACVTALQLGIEPERLRASLAAFAGVRRRFTRLGPAGKATVIDDYAHHPTEIAATLKAARTVAGHDRVTAILQPHRYSRLRDHFDGFCSAFDDADTVLIADVFAAGESPIEGADADALATAIAGYGHKAVARIHHWDELPKHLQAATAEPGLIVFMGAGDITKHAHAYVEAEGGSVAA
jgi:UDP-N-acetylmuramate--alanine ligase